MNALLNLGIVFLMGVLKLISIVLEGISQLFQLLGIIPKEGVFYKLSAEQNRALALAHPMAEKHIELAYAEALDLDESDIESMKETLKPALLHFFELRSDIKDENIKLALAKKLKTTWYSYDLKALRSSDNPRDAMAFACARITFYVRVAYLLGWLPEKHQWKVLQQNTQRSKDCFSDWKDYAKAWSRGRKQWISKARADSLGFSFSQDDIKKWGNDEKHPWAIIKW